MSKTRLYIRIVLVQLLKLNYIDSSTKEKRNRINDKNLVMEIFLRIKIKYIFSQRLSTPTT